MQFPEALPVLDEDYAITIIDEESDPIEQRFVSIGTGLKGRVLVVVYRYIAATFESSRRERHSAVNAINTGVTMKKEDRSVKATYDFARGKRGRVVAESPLELGKVRITIRLDEDLVDYFGAAADRSGGKIGYQTLINAALREYMEGRNPKWEETLRRIVREEIDRNSAA